MRYLLIFLISFAFVTSAFAAKMVPGKIPDVQPLQPPQAGVEVNYSHNITGSSEQGQSASGVPESLNGQDNGQPNSSAQQAAGLADPNGNSVKSGHNFIWIIVLVVALGGGFILYKLYINDQK